MIASIEANLLSSKIHEISEKFFKVALYGPDNYKAALISHYSYTKNKKLKKYAYAYIKELLAGYLSEDDLENLVAEDAIQTLINFKDDVPFLNPPNPRFTFIDLFAGIGGFRIAMRQLNGECVFTSEWDKAAQKTYYANFGEIPFGDITKEETKKWIPSKFDLLCAGFPCQPFSLAGVSKKNALGRKHGFEDEKQGNLFFHLRDIIEKHRPKAFFLENVKNLVSHDKGLTFKVIKQSLLDLGYSFYHKVLDGKYFVPQHRERTIMVGFDSNVFHYKENFSFPELPNSKHQIKKILQKKVDNRYTLSDKLWTYLQGYAKKHREMGNGFGYGLADLNGISRTLSARYYKDGAEILIPQEGKNPRRLTPKECSRLQGFPPQYVIPVSETQAYKQFGNSVVVPLIEAVGENIIKVF